MMTYLGKQRVHSRYNNIMMLKKIYVKISPKRIYFLKFILEGYDGIAILSTIDRKQGLMVIRFPEELQDDLIFLLDSIEKKGALKN